MITIATLSRGRLASLPRALLSVANQDGVSDVTSLVLIDECQETQDYLTRGPLPIRDLQAHYVERSTGAEPKPISSRLAGLRNLAVDLCRTEWIAFLDDDNEYESNHLQSLLQCAHEAGVSAAHSHEKIYWADGTPYLQPRIPWCSDPEKARTMYYELVAKGVFTSHSHRTRDRADPGDHPDAVRTVDMGEWIFRADLLRAFPFPEDYSDDDVRNTTTEDDKLMNLLLDNGVKVACSQRASFRYYLGGFTSAGCVLPTQVAEAPPDEVGGPPRDLPAPQGGER
jgi:hypothetical protein